MEKPKIDKDFILSQKSKVNKDFILSNIIVILCVVSIVSLFLTYFSVEIEIWMMGQFAGEGFSRISGFGVANDGFVGMLVLVLPVSIIIANRSKKFATHKKYVTLCAPIICLINLFVIIRSIISLSVGDGGATMDVFISFGIGAWIMAICMVVIVALSVMQFLGIKTGVSIIDEAASKSNTEKVGE